MSSYACSFFARDVDASARLGPCLLLCFHVFTIVACIGIRKIRYRFWSEKNILRTTSAAANLASQGIQVMKMCFQPVVMTNVNITSLSWFGMIINFQPLVSGRRFISKLKNSPKVCELHFVFLQIQLSKA